MRPLPLTLLLLVLPVAAGAQALTLNFTDSATSTTRTVGPASCGGAISLTYAATGVPCKRLEIWASANACADERGDAPLLASVSLEDLRLGLGNATDDLDVAIAALPLFGEATCAEFTGEGRAHLCASFSVNGGIYGTECIAHQASTEPVVIFDAEPPPVPSIAEVVALDSALRVTVSGSDYARLLVDISLAGSGEWIRAAGAVTSGSGVTIPQLENEVLYDLRVAAEDAALNVSEPSEVAQGMPIATQGFWGDYKEAGGGQAGCSAVGGGLVPAALLGVVLLRRRRRS